METTAVAIDGDACARCGYDIRGLRDDQLCPECGLLVERSRGESTDLSDATPGWLAGVAVGVSLVLLAHVIAAGWTVALTFIMNALVRRQIAGSPVNPVHVGMGGYEIAAALLLIGAWLIARPQRRAGRMASEDHRLRIALRVAAVIPLVACVFVHAGSFFSNRFWIGGGLTATFFLVTVGCAPLPTIGFVYLRRLAARVLHPGLAEHSAIVGVGLSATLLSILPSMLVLHFIGQYTGGKSDWLVLVPFMIFIFAILFGGWSMLNCIRFIIAFAGAYGGAKRKWLAADRSEGAPPAPTPDWRTGDARGL